MTELVVVPPELPSAWLDPLRSADATFELATGLDALAPGRDAEVTGLLSLLTMTVESALLDRLPGLRVVSNMAVGFDNVDLEACKARDIAVGNTPGVLTDATADLTMALLLSAARRLPEAAADARAGRWQTWTPDGWLGVELRGASLGIVGLGKIGSAVAKRARAFGMEILYSSRSDHGGGPDGTAQRLALDELLARADIVSLHVPATPETEALIDADALARMRPGSILINTARGSVVDQDAVLAALDAGHLRAAALDVTSPEPLPPDHPLFEQPRCIIMPHIGSATDATRRRMATLACNNLLAGVRGRPLPHPVYDPHA